MGDSRVTVLVAGMIASDMQYGGATWAVLQYVLGLRQLGHRVYFVEPLPGKKLRPHGTTLAASRTARGFERVTAAFGLSDDAALLVEGTEDTIGLSYGALRDVAAHADVLLNISGMLTDPVLLAPIARRVFLDLDPGFNQAWQS